MPVQDFTDVTQPSRQHTNRRYITPDDIAQRNRLTTIKNLTSYVTAAFIRTCYILPRLSRDVQNQIHDQSALLNRVYALYDCAAFDSSEPSERASARKRLNSMMSIAVPWLFAICQRDLITANPEGIIPFINEAPLQVVNFRSLDQLERLDFNSLDSETNPISLESYLKNILNYLPYDLFNIIESDALDINEEIFLVDRPLPNQNIAQTDAGFTISIDPFYEKLIRVSLIALLFIQHARHLLPSPPQETNILTNEDYIHFLNAHKNALDMISTVGRALLHDRTPSTQLSPRRQARSYIVPCIEIAKKSLPQAIDTIAILNAFPREILNLPLNAMQPSSTHSQ